MKKLFLLLSLAAFLTACMTDTDTSPAGQWLGRWTGPEGTFLMIENINDSYHVTIQNLDGPRNFAAIADAHGLRFNRDGSDETIHAGSGPDTGMKWLVDKNNCLIVKPGEGYCRP